jgi:hypothetical protein
MNERDEPERWLARAAAQPGGAVETDEDRAAALLVHAAPVTVPSEVALARVLRELRHRPAASRPGRLWVSLVAVAFFALGGMVVAAVSGLTGWHRPRPPLRAPRAPAVALAAPAQAPPSAADTPAATSPRPTAAPSDNVLRPNRLAARPGRDGDSGRAREARLLAAAFRALRKDRDPGGALRLLDVYEAMYPRGTLATEATTARVEALLEAGRSTEALEVLEDPRRAAALDRRSLGVRAELRAQAGRCALALRDFETAHASGESALWLAADCRRTLGDPSGARRDLARALALYPNGRYAPQIRQRLADGAGEGSP